MFRITLKNAWGHKRRLLGTTLAVFLGVAFLSGTLVLGDTLSASFDRLFVESTTGTDAVVRNPTSIARGGNEIEQGGLVDAALVDEIRHLSGVETAAASIEGYGAIIDQDGDAVGANGPPRVVGNWIDDADLNPYQLVEGRAPAADDEVVINRGAAEDASLRVGDTATVQVPAPVEATVVGIATFGDEESQGGTTYAAFTLEAAQRHVTGGDERISSVLVEAAPGVSQEELVARIEPLVPEGAEALTGAELADDLIDDVNSEFLGTLRTFLTVFAGIAVLVATFSIYNTFSIIVAQRTREMALLRAVGAGRRQVLASMVGEAVAVGVVASVAGAAAGLAVAGLLKGMFDAFGFGLPAGGLVVTGGAVAVSLIVGIVATLVAATAPAVRASRIAPLAALRDAAVDRSAGSRRRAAVGTGVLGAGVVAVLISAAVGDDSVLMAAGLGAVACLAGVVVVGPVIARPVSGLLGLPFARLRGIGGVLARHNAMRNPRRTSATASALLVGVGVVVVFTVFAASLRTYLDESIDRSFGADLVASSAAFGAGIDPGIAPAVAELPEVDSAVGLGAGAAIVDGDDQGVVYADPAGIDRVLDVDVTEGSLAGLADDQIAVADSIAEDEGWRMGDTVSVEFLDGTKERFTLGALYDESNIVGTVLVPRAAWEPHALQEIDTAVFVSLADGVDIDAGHAAVSRVVDRFGGPDVQNREEYAASRTAGVDMMLGIIYVLLALAIIIALMGIANTLSLSIHERRRELGILRAVGQTRRQLRTMVRDESVLIALFGTASGVALGLFLAWGLIEVVAASSDRIETFTAPLARLAVILVVGAVAGVLAGMRPARRAARLDVLDAVHSD
jgi:putative ABC transport system permease protein